MKNLLASVLFLIIHSLHTNAQDIEKLIVGRWDTIDHMGDSLTFHFFENKTMYMVIRGEQFGNTEMTSNNGKTIKVLLKYSLNVKDNPNQIDILMFADNYYNPISRQEGIIELLSDNMIRISLYGGNPPVRPTNFGHFMQTRVLFRHNTAPEVKGCSQFKNGKFKIEDTPMGDVFVDRKDEIQLQTMENGEKNKLKVIWKDACSYELIPIENYTGQKWEKDTTNIIMHVQIVHVKEQSYIHTSSYNKTRFNLTGEMVRIKD